MEGEGLNKKIDELTSTVNRLSYQFDNYVSHRATINESGEISQPGVDDGGNSKRHGIYHDQKDAVASTDYTQDFSKDENEDRGNWSGRLDFILSCLGFAVGLGNVWRFPYLCYVNGGAVFFIPYCIMLFLVGMPIFAMEVSLGQYTSKGPFAAWECCRLFSGIGIGMACVSIFIAIYYVMIIGWSLFYLFASFTSELPWKHCDREWSTEWCSEYLATGLNITDCNQLGMNLSTNGVCYNGTLPHFIYNKTLAREHGISQVTPSESYLYGYVWGRKAEHGIENMGGLRWQLVLVLMLAWVIVTLCVIKGIKSSGRVVYFTALFPYVVLLILLIRGVTLDGHFKGIEFYILKPDLDKLSEAKVWKDAAVQIFFSLSASYGGLISLSSYNRFHNDCIRDTLIVSLGNCLTSFFAGFVIFSFLGFLAEEQGVPVPEVAASGIGLAFTVYTDAVTRMPLSPLWAILFFLMLITLGLDSEFVFVETLMTILTDYFVSLRKRKWIVCTSIAVFLFLLGLSLCTPAGSIMITLIDTYAGGWNILFIALCECIAIGYVYGAYRFKDDIGTMIGYYGCGCFPWSACSVWWIMCWCLFTPAGVIFILVFSWVDFSPASDGDYTFPTWGDSLGWLMTITCVIGMIIPAIGWMCVETGSFSERLYKLLTPSKYWGPDLVQHRRLVRHLDNFVIDPYGSSTDEDFNKNELELHVQGEANYGYE